MKFPIQFSNNSSTEKAPTYGRIVRAKKEQSSLVGQARQGGLSSTNFDRIYPRIEFWRRQEFFLTIGRVANVVQSYVMNIINREWYYDDTSEGAYEESIKLMEDWEESVEVTTLLENMVRNWIINGVNILSPKDWEPLQLQSIQAKRRDNFGHTTEYVQIINGQEHTIDAKDFLEIPYIEFDREPWGVGLFDSLMNRDYIDIDGKDPRATLELYRQALQDNGKIHHKFASPRTLWVAPEASKETIDNDIVPIMESMRPGDRAAFNQALEIVEETVDGTSRFLEHLEKIIDEVDVGLSSSANRLISEPSAMADAREAGSQEDDKVLGIMEKLRIFMNKEVIPRVTGLEPGLVQFKWGAKDAFDLEFPEPLKMAIDSNILRPEQAAIMLEEQYHWKIPTIEDVEKKFGKLPELEDPNAPAGDETPKEKKPMQSESSLDNQIKKDRLVLMENINRKVSEI